MTNSLDFEEVQESFKNSQELLNELTQKLVQLHEEYELTKKNTESLTAVSKSLDDYSTGAKKLISEVSDLLQENQKLVGTGQELLSSNSLVDIKKTVETIQSETTSIGDEISEAHKKILNPGILMAGGLAIVILQIVIIIQNL